MLDRAKLGGHEPVARLERVAPTQAQSGSRMRASLRVITLLAAAAFGMPAAALAQPAPVPPTTDTPARNTIGPSELQNFSLRGNVTRPADQQPAPVSTAPRAAPARTTVRTAAPTTASRRNTLNNLAEKTASPVTAPAPTISASSQPTAPQAPAASATVALPPLDSAAAPVPATNPAVTSHVVPPTDEPFAPWRSLPLWPWFAAALALAGGTAFLLWRRRPREAYAAGPQFDLLVPAAPEPELRREPQRVPPPQPAPAPPKTITARPALPRSVPTGIVASRLRPALEIAFQPLRCQVDDDRVTIEFELELFNAGAAPARAVLAEASLLNASATQDQELAAFFANPQGIGDRLAIIPPMKRVSFRNQVVAPRAAVLEYELAGRKTFVPVIAFNALYEWSGGRAQSSAAYLVGRDTQRDKLGPLRLDQGAREYRGLGARPLPTAVRT